MTRGARAVSVRSGAEGLRRFEAMRPSWVIVNDRVHGASALLDSIRKQVDWTGRYGGEEFMILLPDCHEETAKAVAEKLRRAVAKQQFQPETRKIGCTISFGVAEMNKTGMHIVAPIKNKILRLAYTCNKIPAEPDPGLVAAIAAYGQDPVRVAVPNANVLCGYS